ncbi:hypothetical protein ID866_595 [Astraeus odoratus]|nr:hypothetical protein ID866_595 [Astraeus odoratus]
MPKKKKTQLRPVARGFTTTSIPKKIGQLDEDESTTGDIQDPTARPPGYSTESTTQSSRALLEEQTSPPFGQEATPDKSNVRKAEEQSLQALMDKYQEKTEKDISKTIRAIENDRRHSKTFMSLPIDPVLIDQVIQLYLEEESQEARKYLDEQSEKVVARLAMTFGTLQRLGFAEDKVEQCLRAMQGVELDDAYEWLFVHCSEAELENLSTDGMGTSQRRQDDVRPPPVDTSEVLQPQTPSRSEASARNTPPHSNLRLAKQSIANSPLTSHDSGISTPASVCSSPEPEDPNIAYARIKMRIVNLQRMGTTTKNRNIVARLEGKLQEAKAHYFFDERDAESLYRTELKKANAQLLQETLRGTLPLPRTETHLKALHDEISVENAQAGSSSDFFSEDDESSGGMLELLETLPAEVQGDGGTTIHVRDMAFSKYKSSKLPKVALVEYVSKVDRYAAVRFDIISGPSRAKRAGVRVLWHRKEAEEWLMEDVACYDESQAEQYIATAALHALTFPKTHVFPFGSLAGPVGPTFHRFFPSVFRNLWDELEDMRKTVTDRLNRDVWAKMQIITDENFSRKITSESIAKVGSDNRNTRYRVLHPQNVEVVSDQLITEFKSRQMRPAYQEMLVHRESLPIAKYRNQILTVLEKSQVLVLCGETGWIILMSATVDADKFSNYFGGCPILHVPGRTYPVDVHFLEDAVEYTGWSITEDSAYAVQLYRKFSKNKSLEWEEATVIGSDDDDDKTAVKEGRGTSFKPEKSYSPRTETTIKFIDERFIPYELIVRLLEHLCFENETMRIYSVAILIFLPGLAEIRRLIELLSEHTSFSDEEWFRIYPLHSTISTENQNAVFDTPPRGVRKIVVSTNIAETGITIPDITCVIDSGKHREMMFDEKRQLSRLAESFIAKSNAAQRRGRAGRVQDGICFHLFTKLRHDTLLAEHPLPEMMRLSLSDLALRIKTMKVKLGGSIEDVLCRALDPPTPVNIRRAISALMEVKALTTTEDLTPMGRLLSTLPLDVHLGKFLLVAVVFRCLDPALTIAAALNSKSPFVKPLGLEQEAERAKDSFRLGSNSDFLTIHNAFSSWRRACANPRTTHTFCRKNFLSHGNLLQIEELRQQLFSYLVDSSFIDIDPGFMTDLNRPRFMSIPADLDKNSDNTSVVNAALAAGLYPKLLSVDTTTGEMRTISNNQTTTFHPSSVNFRKRPKDLAVNYLAYYTLMHSKKLYAWEATPVDDLTILLVCGDIDFKLASDSVVVDRRIRYRLTPKANVAMKILRRQLSNILTQKFNRKPLTESQNRWYEVAMNALGHPKQVPELEDPKLTSGKLWGPASGKWLPQ